MSAPAQAASAKIEPTQIGEPGLGWVLKYTADPGEANRAVVRFEVGGTVAIVTDKGARRIKTGTGCLPLGSQTALCDSTVLPLVNELPGVLLPLAGFRRAIVTLGDKNDSFRQPGKPPLLVTVDGGAGDDDVATGASLDSLTGGPGDDDLRGGAGHDQFVGGTGADDISGGPGSTPGSTDTVLFITPDEPDLPRTVSLDDVANDGTAGEGDNVHSDIENVFVSDSSPTTLIGSDARNMLEPDGGNDTVLGLGGNDWLMGEAGNDSLEGGAGVDRIEGGDGDDFLMARDGEIDEALRCNPGIDLLIADLIDPPATNCEQEDRG